MAAKMALARKPKYIYLNNYAVDIILDMMTAYNAEQYDHLFLSLLNKLNGIGFCGNTYKWFASYLKKQNVVRGN